MPFKFEWLYEDKIAYVTATGNITTEDVGPFIDNTLRYLNETTAEKVHLIGDMTGAEGAGFSLPRAGRLGKDVLDHDRFGWLVVFGMQSKIASIFVGMVSQLFRNHVRSVNTFEETIKVLKRVDQSLPDLSHLQPPNSEAVTD